MAELVKMGSMNTYANVDQQCVSCASTTVASSWGGVQSIYTRKRSAVFSRRTIGHQCINRANDDEEIGNEMALLIILIQIG